MKLVFLSISFCVLFFSSIATAGVVVDKNNINITAGDNFVLVYNVTGISSVCHVNIEITPDDSGFNLSYTPVFTIPSTIHLYINSSMSLQPGTYYITATFYTDGNEQPPRVTRHGYHKPVIPPAQNETDNDTVPPIPPENETDGNETKPPTPPVANNGFNLLWLLFPILVFVLILTLLVLLYVRNQRNKRTLGYLLPEKKKK